MNPAPRALRLIPHAHQLAALQEVFMRPGLNRGCNQRWFGRSSVSRICVRLFYLDSVRNVDLAREAEPGGSGEALQLFQLPSN